MVAASAGSTAFSWTAPLFLMATAEPLLADGSLTLVVDQPDSVPCSAWATLTVVAACAAGAADIARPAAASSADRSRVWRCRGLRDDDAHRPRVVADRR